MGFFSNKNKDKIKFSDQPSSLFTKNFSNQKTYSVRTEGIQIMQNDGVNISAEACACCWDTPIPNGYKDRAEYISKRTKIGHSSVVEHSNHVFYFEIEDKYITDLAEFLSICRYVHTKYKHSNKYPIGYFIIGGSWRAFNDIIRMMSSFDMNENFVFKKVLRAMFNYCNSCGFKDLIKKEVISDEFMNCEGTISDYSSFNHYEIDSKTEIINADNFPKMIENIEKLCPEPELFTMYDLLDMCTITVLFKNMSRIITQQLTRHRNGITQESQRYVNYSKGGFNSPALFKDKYDPKYLYSIQFGKSSQKMTLQEIGDSINSIYGQLIDENRTNKHNLQFEDARGFLANNTQCGKIYITFTWRSFFMFLFLREDLHAQVEIREFAKNLGEWFRTSFPDFGNLYDALEPYSINNSNYTINLNKSTSEIDSVDEIISEGITEEEINKLLDEQIINQEKYDENKDEN